MGLGRYNENSIKPTDLEPPDQDQIEWCQAIITECKDTAALQVNQLKKTAPLVYQQLSEDAEAEEMPMAEYLSMEGGIAEYVRNLVSWCTHELQKADRYEQIKQLASIAADKQSIPWGKLDIFSKYQAGLDNQIYKAMKALWEAQ
ncbi:MAG: hypothetical protein GY727_03290 [Gammaproteobacteria bacterium]|nr:hypothetical protein [Gammaproteobacteria bacterium]